MGYIICVYAGAKGLAERKELMIPGREEYTGEVLENHQRRQEA